MAVTDNGEIYGWGYNGNGQLGIGTNANQPNPCRVTNLQGIFIVKIVCGYAHTLALSDTGVVYVWGSNSYGQLGIGSKANQVSPVRLNADIGRVLDIASVHYNHISACMTQDSKCYMWGQCRGQSLTQPTLTPFKSMHDIFACFATPAVSYKPMELNFQNENRVLNDLGLAFDDANTSDLKFLVEGKEIYVHKSILKIRCEHYRQMFNGCWIENDVNRNEIEISQFPYTVYYAFLQYLYTDEVSINAEDAISLLDLANSYCETDLKQKCERLIRNGITVENVSMLYSAAIKYEAKELESFCFRFALSHLTAVTQTEAFNKLDEATIKKFIVKAAKKGAFKH